MEGSHIGVWAQAWVREWLGHAADVALLGLHGGHARVQPDHVPVRLKVPLNSHKQQAAQHSSQRQVYTCMVSDCHNTQCDSSKHVQQLRSAAAVRQRSGRACTLDESRQQTYNHAKACVHVELLPDQQYSSIQQLTKIASVSTDLHWALADQ